MKTKKLLNTSEYKTDRILESVLREAGFRVYPELALSKVLEIDRKTLSKKLRETLSSASFDFVVYNEDSFPEFAVEFDGPHHQNHETKRNADIRKNLLCCMAGLPLLRFGDEFLTEYEKTTLLGYVLQRFVDWRNESDQISQEEADIADYLTSTGASEEEYDQVQDPRIMWDLTHPFPASLEIAESLYSTYGVVSSHINSEAYAKATSLPQFLFFQFESMGSHPIDDYQYNTERRYELRRMTREALGTYQSEHLHFTSVAVSYQWRLPTVKQWSRDSSKCQLLIENVHGQELPGISMSELADHFCDFLALNELRSWLGQNLHRSS